MIHFLRSCQKGFFSNPGKGGKVLQCRICGCDVEAEQAVGCARCAAPFHRDCWDFNGRCGIYGCGGLRHTAYRALSSDAVLAIDDSTRPPFRIAPLAEAFLRKLPGRSRALALPVAWGLLGPMLALAVARLVFGLPLHDEIVAVIFACGLGSSLVAAALGPAVRRRPGLMAALFFLLATAAAQFVAGSPVNYVQGTLYITLGTIAASALTELLVGPLRGHPRLGTLAAAAIRGILTTALVFLYFCITTVLILHLSIRGSFEGMFVFSLLGLFVAGAPLEMSKSALVHRLKKEAAEKSLE